MEIDEINKEILRLLRDNGRMSFTEIGEKVGMTRVGVKKRVKQLEELGIIRGYKAVIHREGSVKMYMEITTVEEDAEDVLAYLDRTGYVTELYIMTGKNRCVLRHRADTGAFASGHSAAATDSVLVSHFPFNHNDVVFCHTLKQRVR